MALYAGISTGDSSGSHLSGTDSKFPEKLFSSFLDLLRLLVQSASSSHVDTVFNRMLSTLSKPESLMQLFELKMFQAFLCSKQDNFKSSLGIMHLLCKSLVGFEGKNFRGMLGEALFKSPYPLLVLHLYSLYLDKECIPRFKNLQNQMAIFTSNYHDFIDSNLAKTENPESLKNLLVSLSHLTLLTCSESVAPATHSNPLVHRCIRFPFITRKLLEQAPSEESPLLALVLTHPCISSSSPNPIGFYLFSRHAFALSIKSAKPLNLYRLTLDGIKRFFLISAPLLESLKSNQKMDAFQFPSNFPGLFADSIQGVMMITRELKSRAMQALSKVKKEKKEEGESSQESADLEQIQTLLRDIDIILMENWQITSLDKERTAYIRDLKPSQEDEKSSNKWTRKLNYDKIELLFKQNSEAFNLPPLFRLSFLLLKHGLESAKEMEKIEEKFAKLMDFLGEFDVASVQVYLKSLSSQDMNKQIFCKLRLLGSKIIQKYSATKQSTLKILDIIRFVFARSFDLKSVFTSLVFISKKTKSMSNPEKLFKSKTKKRKTKHLILLNPKKSCHLWTRLQLKSNCQKHLHVEESRKLEQQMSRGGFARMLLRSQGKVRKFLDENSGNSKSINLLGQAKMSFSANSKGPTSVIKKKLLYSKLLLPQKINLKNSLNQRSQAKNDKFISREL